ncbi:MAG: thioredoxin family protein [Proteobacteria bacterium]|nr:thioredoxin family protein [Pseudomonadota bacterium]
MEIQVLGPGCPQCDRLENDVMAALAELNLSADLRHVTDVKEIGRTGVMGMPALIINGRVVAVGVAPPKEKIKRWIEEISNQEEESWK